MRRFFAKNSYCAADPFIVIAACVYVAAKAEESPVHIKSVVSEATRVFQEVGHRHLPADNSSLAEMEFYLLEELEFDLILYHPYRSLVAIYDSVRYKASTNAPAKAALGLGLGLADEVGQRGLRTDAENEAGLADAPELEELDDQALQMAWFVLNDTYKTDIPLAYPPHLIAIASIWLALVLHPPASAKIKKSIQDMDEVRRKLREGGGTTLSPPPNDALTYLASLNISIPLVHEIIQHIVAAYQLEADVASMVADGPGMVKRLERMRDARRSELVKAQQKPDG